MDYATQRKNMVESQVRPSDVTDRRIIRAMLELPREAFVPEKVRELAYMDGPVPIAPGDERRPRRALLEARTLAKLVQAAEIDATSTVLAVGAGSGYGAALIGRLAQSVVALECDGVLAAAAREALGRAGASNVVLVEGDLPAGWVSEAPYDAIVVDGAVTSVPPALLDQLKDGGRLVAIVGDRTAGRATVVIRDGSVFGAVAVFDAAAEVLPGFEKVPAFTF
ncbi:MAG: protein-L-isoaspartate O-methyltransferase [Hyphomicrobium sp.]|uniref:protein-L-isoaspartate O-methyltransferase family protein n=1 Tax=Hyphomicrobium sp. TaxID=82 RepID=UPI003D11DF96